MKHTNQRRLLVKQIMERSDGIKPYINKRTRTVSVFGAGMVDWDRFEIVIEEELGAWGTDVLQMIVDMQNDLSSRFYAQNSQQKNTSRKFRHNKSPR